MANDEFTKAKMQKEMMTKATIMIRFPFPNLSIVKQKSSSLFYLRLRSLAIAFMPGGFLHCSIPDFSSIINFFFFLGFFEVSRPLLPGLIKEIARRTLQTSFRVVLLAAILTMF
jgi:hypothetical protein